MPADFIPVSITHGLIFDLRHGEYPTQVSGVAGAPLALPPAETHFGLVTDGKVGLRRGGEASCLQGVGELLQGLVPLFVRVDPGDVRVLAEALQPHFAAPTLILYDRIPNGVGLAERIFRVHREILAAALALVQKCACRSGCPSCVGPQASLGTRSKGTAVTILQAMLGDTPVAAAEAAW